MRLNAPTGPDSTFELRVSRNESDAREFTARTGLDTSVRFWQYDTEGFHTVARGGGRLHTTYGAAWRYAASRSSCLYGATPLQANRTARGPGAAGGARDGEGRVSRLASRRLGGPAVDGARVEPLTRQRQRIASS